MCFSQETLVDDEDKIFYGLKVSFYSFRNEMCVDIPAIEANPDSFILVDTEGEIFPCSQLFYETGSMRVSKTYLIAESMKPGVYRFVGDFMLHHKENIMSVELPFKKGVTTEVQGASMRVVGVNNTKGASADLVVKYDSGISIQEMNQLKEISVKKFLTQTEKAELPKLLKKLRRMEMQAPGFVDAAGDEHYHAHTTKSWPGIIKCNVAVPDAAKTIAKIKFQLAVDRQELLSVDVPITIEPK